MKTKIIFTITVLFASMFCGCERWLDLDPAEKELEVNYYSNEEQAYKGLIAVYAMLKTQYFSDWSSWYMMYSMPSDDAVPHGGGRSDRPEFWSMHEFNVTPSTFGIIDTWRRCYYGIYRCNLLLENIEGSSQVYERIKAEATMLRAYFYFDLVRLWGEVPLITKVLPQSEYYQPKVPKKKIYDQIVKDLIDASKKLPNELTADEKYRMSSWAAKALLGKVYVYMASPFYNYTDKDYYTLASEQLKDVIDNGTYRLLEDYDQIWWYDNEFNDETIIEIAYGPSNDADGDNNIWGDGSANETNIMIQLNGPRAISANDTIINGWGFDMVTPELVNEYRKLGDSVRLHGTVLAEWQLNDWGITVGEKNALYTGFYTKKRTTWKGAKIGAHQHWGYGTNERALRLADVYLLYAEAQNRLGNDQEARKHANIIRNRADVNNIMPEITSSGDALYADIKLERRLELAQEGQRFQDLVRWGMAKAELSGAGFVEGKHEFYPIPEEEIENSNGVLKQHDNY